MDSIFFLDEASRLSFLQALIQSFGCIYVCLWSYFPVPSNCLVFLDGLFQEAENTQLPSSSSSSSTTMAAQFFNQYRQFVFSATDGLVPGLSMAANISCLLLNQSELQSLSSADSQRQFYLAARIQTSVFLGSINGEIELGFSTVISQFRMQMLMNNFIPGDFTPQVIPLRSLSMEDSSKSFSITYNCQKTSRIAEEPTENNPISINQKPSKMNSFAENFNQQFPARETEHASMTNALIAVLSSNPSSSAQPSAFESASSSLFQKNQTKNGSSEFLGNLNLAKIGEHRHENRLPPSYYSQHRILERHRRKKLGENFRALRSVLPPTTKKDRDSVLVAAREKLISSEAEVAELKQKNQTLMAAQGFAETKETTERFRIRVSRVSNEPPSEGLTVDLQIYLTGHPSEHLIIRILEFLKMAKNLSLVSMEANAQETGPTSITNLKYRLNVEGMEWNEAAFQEAIARIVSDVALNSHLNDWST